MEVQYPEEYPQVVPILNIVESDGSFLLEQEEQDEESDEEEEEATDVDYETVLGAQIEDLSDSEIKNLSDILSEEAEENVGMPSVFSLASLLKDKAEELFADKLKHKEREREQELAAQEEKEQQKFRGTPVTPESFAEWRRKFRQEMKLEEAPKETTVSGKLTGKQIFERGLNKDEDDDDDDNTHDVEHGVRELHV